MVKECILDTWNEANHVNVHMITNTKQCKASEGASKSCRTERPFGMDMGQERSGMGVAKQGEWSQLILPKAKLKEQQTCRKQSVRL